MHSIDDRRSVRFWQPDTPSVTGMLRLEREDRAKITFSEHFTVVVVYEGAFDGWYHGGVRTLVAGSLKLKGGKVTFVCGGATVTCEGSDLTVDAPQIEITGSFKQSGTTGHG